MSSERLAGTGSQCLSSPCACACVITAVIGGICPTYTGSDDLPHLEAIAQFLTLQKTLKHLALIFHDNDVSQVVTYQPGDAMY